MDIVADVKERTIDKDATLLHGLKIMDSTGYRSLLVLDKTQIFIGILSIGDIQRAIINNIALDSSVNSVIRSHPRIAHEDYSLEQIKNEMLRFRMEFMPVIDKSNQVIRIYLWEDFFIEKKVPPKKQFELPVVIMAGGFGTRLKPLTNVLPKPLIPIGEKTMIEEIFDHFGTYGCRDFYISVNYKAELIEFYINNQNLPFNLSFFKEEKPLGTAGSLTLLKDRIHETFFVSNCDILIEQDYSEILDYHQENKHDITIVAALKHYPIPYGTIQTGENGVLIELIEKPELTFKINSGMYILEPNLLNLIPDQTFFHITDLIHKVQSQNMKIGVFPVSERSWKDIGSWKSYYEYLK